MTDWAEDSDCETVEYRATAVTLDGTRAPVTEPRTSRASAEASARNCRDVGMTGLRVESRIVRTWVGPWTADEAEAVPDPPEEATSRD